MTTIGIYGGSFNPIHLGHLAVGRTMLTEAALNEVWFMVSPQNPLKSAHQLLPDRQRLILAQVALQFERRMHASDFEFYLPRPSYTYDTLQALSAAYPNCRFSLIIGADNWQMFHQWYRHDDILRQYPILIFPRADAPVDPTTLPPSVRLVSVPTVDVSSTQVRHLIATHQPITHLVPPPVAAILSKRFAK